MTQSSPNTPLMARKLKSKSRNQSFSPIRWELFIFRVFVFTFHVSCMSYVSGEIFAIDMWLFVFQIRPNLWHTGEFLINFKSSFQEQFSRVVYKDSLFSSWLVLVKSLLRCKTLQRGWKLRKTWREIRPHPNHHHQSLSNFTLACRNLA